MADPQDKAESAEEQKQEPVPSSETENNQSQEAAPETEETSEAPAGDSEEKLELDDEVKQRTAEQFEKLKEQLRQTRDELFEVKSRVEPQKAESDKPLYDKSTGLVDIEALEQLRRDAREAKKTVEQLQKERADQEVNSLYDAYPQLKEPKTSSDKEFFDEAEKVWVHSQTNPEKYGGKPLSQKQAADFAKKRMTNKTQDKSESKEQASAGASGQPSQGVASKTSEEDTQRLQVGTRLGDRDSMIARMRAIRETK